MLDYKLNIKMSFEWQEMELWTQFQIHVNKMIFLTGTVSIKVALISFLSMFHIDSYKTESSLNKSSS